jgi:peptidoglycan hydrolase CwlO-like protein
MNIGRRTVPIRLVAACAAALGLLGVAAAVPLSSSASPSLGQLNSQLGAEQARQQNLSSKIGGLTQLISSLNGQIALVESREAAVRVDLANDRAQLARISSLLQRERRVVAELQARLARARQLLSNQLVSSYESDKPNIVSVVLESSGFTDLLERIQFLHQAEQQQQGIIQITKLDKAQADNAERRLAKLEATDMQITEAAVVRERALAGMNSLLQSKQSTLQQARAIQQSALQASRARGNQLQNQISQLEAQQAAAQQAAASAAAPAALGPSGGWAIPYAIVLCESGGQNLPPNSAGASGYYQIVPGTWRLFGGTGPAAYLASKAEQDAVAARIWNNGAGASNWVCAGIVGIH